jgi:hypothetical protein
MHCKKDKAAKRAELEATDLKRKEKSEGEKLTELLRLKKC